MGAVFSEGWSADGEFINGVYTVDEFEEDMEDDVVLICGVENPDECEACG